MFTISRILAPIVFSENCRGALCYAVSLASRFHSELTILHVLEPLAAFGIESTAGLEYIDKCRREWALDEMDKLTFPAGRRMAVKTATVEGDAATEICHFAKTNNIDLVIMPSHGHGPFRRFLLGSVTAKVLHDCVCPVWTGAHLETALIAPPIEVRHVMAAVDFASQTDRVLEWSWGMASEWHAALTLVHVVPCMHDAVAQRVACDGARELLQERAAAAGADVECIVQAGPVAPSVCNSARALSADLMVIGRGHRAGGPGHLRSTAYEITRESPCPVSGV